MAAQLQRRAVSTLAAVRPEKRSIEARDSYGSCVKNTVAITSSVSRAVPLTTETISSRKRRRRWMTYWPVSS